MSKTGWMILALGLTGAVLSLFILFNGDKPENGGRRQ